MTHSPSDCWRLVEQFGYITVEDCIAMKMQNGKRHVVLQICIGRERTYKQTIAANPLSMLAIIDKFRRMRDKLRADHVKQLLEQEQAKATAEFLEIQRAAIARKHQEKLADEQRRAQDALRYVSAPIRAILERVKPVVDPWAYRNVYGKPAEVFIF